MIPKIKHYQFTYIAQLEICFVCKCFLRDDKDIYYTILKWLESSEISQLYTKLWAVYLTMSQLLYCFFRFLTISLCLFKLVYFCPNVLNQQTFPWHRYEQQNDRIKHSQTVWQRQCIMLHIEDYNICRTDRGSGFVQESYKLRVLQKYLFALAWPWLKVECKRKITLPEIFMPRYVLVCGFLICIMELL